MRQTHAASISIGRELVPDPMLRKLDSSLPEIKYFISPKIMVGVLLINPTCIHLSFSEVDSIQVQIWWYIEQTYCMSTTRQILGEFRNTRCHCKAEWQSHFGNLVGQNWWFRLKKDLYPSQLSLAMNSPTFLVGHSILNPHRPEELDTLA
jgi:hypothetical protein